MPEGLAPGPCAHRMLKKLRFYYLKVIPMKRIALLIAPAVIISSLAHADNRQLVCTNKSGKVVFDICGVRGCKTVVTVNKKSTTYNLKRVKNSDGSLTYSARAGSRPTCEIDISALRFGQRKLEDVSCASKLEGASCAFVGIGSSSSSGSTGSSGSSLSSASSSSRSS